MMDGQKTTQNQYYKTEKFYEVKTFLEDKENNGECVHAFFKANIPLTLLVMNPTFITTKILQRMQVSERTKVQ
jgi:hypothetical protein